MTERRALNIFIMTILNVKSTSLAIAFATDAFGEVSMYHKLSAKSMYTRYKRDFMRVRFFLNIFFF